MCAGSVDHAYGAGAVMAGVGGLIGSGVGFVAALSTANGEDPKLALPIAGAGTSLLFMFIGVAVVSAGNHLFERARDMQAPVTLYHGTDTLPLGPTHTSTIPPPKSSRPVFKAR